MEYLRIDEDKLKITLTEEDLLFYGMDLASLSYSSTETRRAFWAILDDAKHATGFDAAATRVSVQIYASRSGGCEMFVMGAGEEDPATECLLCDEIDGDGSCAALSRTGSQLTVHPAASRHFKRAMGEFGKLADLLSVCRALTVCGYDGDSSAWQMGERYYLHLSGSRGGRGDNDRVNASGVIWEFGSAVKDLSVSYLAEHGKCICNTRAVHRLAPMAT